MLYEVNGCNTIKDSLTSHSNVQMRCIHVKEPSQYEIKGSSPNQKCKYSSVVLKYVEHSSNSVQNSVDEG